MKKQIKGYSNIVKGNSKQLTGKVVGDKEMEAEGIVQESAGKVQVALGDLESDIKKIKK